MPGEFSFQYLTPTSLGRIVHFNADVHFGYEITIELKAGPS